MERAFSNSIGTTVEMWNAQVRALADRYRCLRYDTRGHGRSPVVDREANIEDLSGDLAGLLDALGIGRAHVAGLSLGGMTAQSFAARFPERTESLTVMATSSYLPHGWAERIEAVRREGMGAIADAVLARWFTPPFREAQPAQVAALRDRFLAMDPAGYAACCAAIRDLDLRGSNAAITAPTLIIAGADDPATPVSMMEEMRDRIPGAELVVVPQAAHILTVEQPEAVNGYLAAFLDRHAAPTKAPVGGVSFQSGLANRKSVLGVDHVQRSLERAGAFAMPWQDFITRTAWGEIWGDPTIPWKTRSMVTLAMMIALHREEEFKLHVRPALRNGVTIKELQSLLLQAAIYAGVPATNAAFRWTKEVLGDELD
jgi:3-oxoadipate enol-lactonase/4-carboxymuconolactone decarboxylase